MNVIMNANIHIFFNSKAFNREKYEKKHILFLSCVMFLVILSHQTTTTMREKKSIICSVLLLVSGGMLYVLFRSRHILMLRIADATPLSRHLSHLRETASHWHPYDWVVYNLPGALWAGAYILFIHSLMHGVNASTRWKWACVIPLIGAFSELGQAFGVVPGTFDLLDLAGYLLPLVVYSFYVKSTIHCHGQ